VSGSTLRDSLEYVFDNGRRARRPVDPPVDVLVDLTQLVPLERIRWGSDTPLWVRNHGLGIEPVRARLLEWVLTATGDWCGVCQITVSVDGAQLHLVQLVPRSALRQVEPPPAASVDPRRSRSG
jgi:hypothetical protein